MDGNSRWAKANHLVREKGHKKGVETLKDILLYAYDTLKLNAISMYAFSIENWNRSQKEVGYLMRLFAHFYKNEFQEIKKRKVKVIHSGILTRLSDKTIKIIQKMKDETKDLDKGILNLVFNYGGRNELIEATKKIASDYKNDKINLEQLNDELFKSYLFNPELPDVDLVIRTSGEMRISNFLLWQIAYAEFYFTDILWPDFKPVDLIKAIHCYQNRERRFGGR